MEGYFTIAGFVLLAVLIIIIMVQYFNINMLDGFEENSTSADDKKVFKAARAFAQGVSSEEVKGILLKCIDFDEEDADEILSLSEKHKSDDDGGYSFFVKICK